MNINIYNTRLIMAVVALIHMALFFLLALATDNIAAWQQSVVMEAMIGVVLVWMYERNLI